MKELTEIQPFMWIAPKPNEIKAKISGIIPAGSDTAYPYTRLKVEFETGEIMVMKESLVRQLFQDMEIIGTFKESFEETIARLEAEKPKVEEETEEVDKSVLIAEAKALGIKSPHVMGIEKLQQKIAEAKGQ